MNGADADGPSAAQALAACAEITRREARNFHYGLRLLPSREREALYAVYAWMRVLDDLADDESRSASDKRGDLARFFKGPGLHGGKISGGGHWLRQSSQTGGAL